MALTLHLLKVSIAKDVANFSYKLHLIRGMQSQVDAAAHVAFVPQQFRLTKLLAVSQEEHDISDGSDPALSLAMEEAATWAACD